MAKLDVYLRSIKQLGARGAVLTSGQAVTLRFATGDRHATQITAHDQLIAVVREVAPPAALELVDKNKPARFELEAIGGKWAVGVAPRPGAWQVTIDPLDAPAAAPAPAGPRGPREVTTAPINETTELPIERGQYAAGVAPAPVSSGSQLLDQLTAGARAAYASDVYLSAGSPAFQRVGLDLAATADRTRIDAETLTRELGLIAPSELRGAWGELGPAVFAYGDGAGRVRVTLTRDHRGPGATLRLLPAEPPALAAIGLAKVADWLHDRGLILVAGPSGAGKTTALAALVRQLGDNRRRVVTLEDPIELVHVSPWISQRAVGDQVRSVADGVQSAMREGADAIAIDAPSALPGGSAARSSGAGPFDGAVGPEAADAVLEAVAGGHLVLVTLTVPRAHVAVERMLSLVRDPQRDLARKLYDAALLGTIGPVVSRSGRGFDLAGRGIAST